MGDNPRDYYYGKMNNKDLNGYYTNDSHMAVSYTHLDVYKRQLYISAHNGYCGLK